MDKLNTQHLKEWREELQHLEFRIEAVTKLIAGLERNNE